MAAVSQSADVVPVLSFEVVDAVAERHSAAPALNFALGIVRTGGGPVRSVLLDVQLQIAARRRPYSESEQAGLGELFGTPDRWATTLRTLLWTRTTLVVPPFTDATEATLTVPCSYDLEAVAPNYLSALDHGDVPLEFLFSGSVFYTEPGAAWMRLGRPAFDRLRAYKAQHGLRTLEDAVERLLGERP